MKIYVAGASSEWERANKMMRDLEAQGHTITFDWTKPFADGVGNGDLTFAKATRYALLDSRAVLSAERVVILVPSGDLKTTGAWTELGIGLFGTDSGNKVYIVADDGFWKKNIFLSLAKRSFPTDAAFLEYAEDVFFADV